MELRAIDGILREGQYLDRHSRLLMTLTTRIRELPLGIALALALWLKVFERFKASEQSEQLSAEGVAIHGNYYAV